MVLEYAEVDRSRLNNESVYHFDTVRFESDNKSKSYRKESRVRKSMLLLLGTNSSSEHKRIISNNTLMN